MINKILWKYSPPDVVRIAWSLMITKLFFNHARLIRQPTRIRGYENMSIGKGFTTGQYCRIEAGISILNKSLSSTSLYIGCNVQINDNCHIGALDRIFIGDHVLIASNVFITDHDHGDTNIDTLLIAPSSRALITAPVYIGNNVWIGEGVKILKGVTLGQGSVVGAGAIVTKSFPDNSIIVGIPARKIN